MPAAMRTMEAQCKRFQSRIISATGLDIILVIFGKICFPFHPKNLPEAKSKCNGLISSAEEISKQPIVDSAMWFLVTTLKQAYNEDEQEGQKEIQSVQFTEKKSKAAISVLVLPWLLLPKFLLSVPALTVMMHCDVEP